MKIKTSDVKVKPDRQRKTFERLEELGQSMKKFGQLQPIVVDEDNFVIAGERRYRAAVLAEMPEVEISILSDLSEGDKKAIEYEENLQRENLGAWEEISALKQLHDIKTSENEGSKRGRASGKRWTYSDTAMLLGKSLSPVHADIQLATRIMSLPDDIRDRIISKAGQTKDSLRKELDRLVSIITRRVEAKDHMVKEAIKEEKKEEDKANSTYKPMQVPTGQIKTKKGYLRCIPAEEGLKDIPSCSVSVILCDPPYGVLEGSAMEKDAQNGTTQKGWDDDPKKTLELMQACIPEFFRVMSTGSHLYLFCSTLSGGKEPFENCYSGANFYSIGRLLTKHGFSVRPVPLIWYKTNIQGYKASHQHWPFSHEICLFARKGVVPIAYSPKGDVLEHTPIAGVHKVHKTEKPVSLMKELLKPSELPYGIVLDPFCGSGSSLIAALDAKMRYIGFDIDPVNIAGSHKRILEKEGEMGI